MQGAPATNQRFPQHLVLSSEFLLFLSQCLFLCSLFMVIVFNPSPFVLLLLLSFKVLIPKILGIIIKICMSVHMFTHTAELVIDWG